MKIIRQLFLATAVSLLVGAGVPVGAQTLISGAATGTNTCSGTVRDADGKPVAGATVEYWCYGENSVNPFSQELSEAEKQTATAGADGAFSFRVAPGAGVLVAQKTGLAAAWKLLSPTINSGRDTEGKLVLTAPGVLAGVVLDEANQPVAQAEVFVVLAFASSSQNNNVTALNALFGKPARDHYSARTDAAGRFRIENFPTNANAVLGVKSPGKVLRPLEQEINNIDEAGFRAGQADIKLVIEPAGSIAGSIVGGDTGQPMSDALVRLQSDAPQGFLSAGQSSARSGTNGAFHFDAVLAGSYRLQVSFATNHAGWVAATVPMTVTAGQPTRGVLVKAVRGTLLEATVLGSDRKPQPKVNVTVYSDGTQFTGVSDSNGLAKLFVLPGDYRVSAYRQPQAIGQGAVTVEAGKTNRLEIELTERSSGYAAASTQKITGVVQLPDGQPAAGAAVQLIGAYGPRNDVLKTDAAGKFELEWNPQPLSGQSDATTCILVRDVDRNLAVAQDLEEDSTNLVLKLEPGLTLFGRAEAAGRQLTNATAQLVFWSGNRGMWLQGLTRTNALGQFEIPALPPGRRYGVSVSAAGYGQKQNHNLEISADPGRQELDPVELKLANLKLAGQVLDADDKPVARCYVNMDGDDQPSANARTDSDGRFSFAQVCEGTVRLSANSQQAHGSISAEGGDTNVVLRLGENMSSSSTAKTQKLKGVVTDANGQPVAGVQVAVFPNSGSRWVKTGTNGEYSLNWMLQSWQMQNGGALLVLRDELHHLAATEELPEEATNLNVKLKPALVVAGQVKNTAGAPLATAQVRLLLKSGNSYEQLNESTAKPVNAEGRFEIKCLPPDAHYLVYASAKGYGQVQQQLQPEYETNRLELPAFVLPPADRVIAGQILKEDDKPASGVTVNLNGEGQPGGNLTTDSKGRFHFQVCEGQIRLYAYSQNGSGSAQATVEAGDTNIVMTLSSNSGGVRQAPRRPSLKGSQLPNLTLVNLAAEAAPVGQPVLLCLFDAGQRPSRYAMRQLDQQVAALRQQKIVVLGLQTTPGNEAIFNEWKTASPVSFPLGRVAEKNDQTKWAATVSALPWLILTDASHRVIAEGFALGELDAQVKKLAK